MATKEQLPPLPLPRTVKLNTSAIKAHKGKEANPRYQNFTLHSDEWWRTGSRMALLGSRAKIAWREPCQTVTDRLMLTRH